MICCVSDAVATAVDVRYGCGESAVPTTTARSQNIAGAYEAMSEGKQVYQGIPVSGVSRSCGAAADGACTVMRVDLQLINSNKTAKVKNTLSNGWWNYE